MPEQASGTIERTRFTCPSCQYDLRPHFDGESEGGGDDAVVVCPECGLPTDRLAAGAAAHGSRGWGYFVMWLWVGVGALVMLGCVGLSLAVLLSAILSSGP